MRSGFGGFNKISSASTAKRSVIDSFGTIDRAIKTITGDEYAIIHTTAVPSTIISDSNNLVSKWTPLNHPASGSLLHFTQSADSLKPTVSTVHTLGKYYGIHCVTDDTLTSANGPVGNFKVRGTFIYYKQILHASGQGRIYNYASTNNAATSYPGVGVYNAFAGQLTGLNNQSYFYNPGSGNKNPVVYSSTSTALFGSGTNAFRYGEDINDTINRTVSSSIYDSTKSLITIATNAQAGATVSPASKSSFFFTSASVGNTQADWDTIFPQKGFLPAKLTIGEINSGQIAYYTVVQLNLDSVLTSDQVKNMKNLLDKVYGA